MKELISKKLELVNLALDRLYEQDPILFQKRVHERTIAFRFSLYFHELIKGTEFEGLDLDFEYNKREDDYKITPSKPNGSYPDLILHKRGDQEQNILVMEFKCVWSKDSWDSDFNKLSDYTLQELDNGYYYGLGLFIELGKIREKVRIEVFQNGRYE